MLVHLCAEKDTKETRNESYFSLARAFEKTPHPGEINWKTHIGVERAKEKEINGSRMEREKRI